MTKGNYSIDSWRWKIFQSSRTYACKWQNQQQKQQEKLAYVRCDTATTQQTDRQSEREREKARRELETPASNVIVAMLISGKRWAGGLPGKVNKQYGGVGLPWSSRSSDWYRRRRPGAITWPRRPAPRSRWRPRPQTSASSWKAVAPPLRPPPPPIRA